jgi:hypothetical protein
MSGFLFFAFGEQKLFFGASIKNRKTKTVLARQSKIAFRLSSCGKKQRPILNFVPRGKLWLQGRSCPPGVNFVPEGWSYPLGVKFSAHPFTPLNNRDCSPLEVNEGVNIPTRKQISPLGDNFTTRGPGVKLRMALRLRFRPLSVCPSKKIDGWKKNRYHFFNVFFCSKNEDFDSYAFV